MTRRIDIVEVGPRDGLQNDPADLTTEQKLEFIARLEEAGVRRMESGSFVSPKAVPKMADSAAVFAGVDRSKPTRHIALALNEKAFVARSTPRLTRSILCSWPRKPSACAIRA